MGRWCLYPPKAPRYSSIEEYAHTKEKIIQKKKNSFSIISLDDTFCKKIYNNNINNNIIPISTSDRINNSISLFDNIIYDDFFDKKEICIKFLSNSLIGQFNYQNKFNREILNAAYYHNSNAIIQHSFK